MSLISDTLATKQYENCSPTREILQKENDFTNCFG